MEKPTFVRATNVVTLRCNLNCKLCVISSPYYRSPWHPSLDYVNKVTDKLFEIANYIIYDLTGGEPLIRTDLPQILDHMLQYKDCVSNRFGFQTNGSLPISDDLLYVTKQFGQKFKIIMDDYGNGLSKFAEENYHLLKSNGVPVELRHQYQGNEYCDGWVDYIEDGKISRSPQNAQELFSKCAQPQIMGFCANAVEGQVVPCPVMYSLKKRFNIHPKEHEYIDLFDENESLEEKRAKWKNFYELTMLDACKYCNGICNDSQRFVPAVQLTKEELRNIRFVEE